MRILKLYLDNFKGVAAPAIIDFEKDISILKGPNGFGKTTIFDAIELCITGEIYRTSVFKNVTEDRQDYTDAFYRNRKNKDTILNLLVEGYDGKKFTIVKVLPASSTGRPDEQQNTTRYKAAEWRILDTYLVGEDEFAQTMLNLSDKRTQQEVEAALVGPDGGSLTDLYRLFAYLQQAENTFYLKKTEKNRKAELDHLFGTDLEANVVKKLNDRLILLNRLEGSLRSKTTNLGNVKDDNQDAKYVKLLDLDNEKFDSPHPYDGTDIDQIDEKHLGFRDRVVEIEKFLISFDPEVYKKNKTRDSIFQLAKTDLFLDYTVLRELLEETTYRKLLNLTNLKKYINSDNFLKYFVLQNFINPETMADYETNTKFYRQYLEYRKGEYRPTTVEARLKEIVSWDEGIEIEERQAANSYLDELDKSTTSLNDTQVAISDLIEVREDLSSAFEKMPASHHEDESCECPLCGFDWKNISQLTVAIDEKTQKLNKYLEGASKNLNTFKKKIEEEFLNDFEKKIDRYLEDTSSRYNFLQLLKRILQASEGYEFESHSVLLKEIVKEAEGLIWQVVKTNEALVLDSKKLADLARQSVLIDEKVFERVSALKGYKYDDSISLLESQNIKLENPWHLNTLNSEDSLNSQIGEVRAMLVDKAQSIEINVEKLGGNLTYMYKDYFQEDSEKLLAARKKIKLKLAYLEAEYQNNRRAAYRVLTNRHKKIEKIRDLTKETKQKYEGVLKTYKREMIEKIQLPFYIYTAKILQNYQQGMGVFIASPGSNSDAIRFITESESNHDIVHHLSSGQLAVVSIAFTLAINRVYGNTSLGILSIDDPVYELDTLNVHSFVELLRRSFMDNYQIILSTHDDDSALYMKYRFEKIEQEKVALIDVQKTFFNTAESPS
ncbi:AAA family ATPase [Candidatus Saccharibacteria bacterium]|nr:AAA family ATPase [Candidatus Saccharibacteria bacterium]